MVLSSQDSGVLEIFWRHPARARFLQHTVRDLFALCSRPPDVLRLKQWLEAQPGCQSIRSGRDPRIIERIFASIRTGDVVVVKDSTGPHLPETGISLTLPSGSVLLLPGRRGREHRDLAYALGWLPTLTDDAERQRLRGMLWGAAELAEPKFERADEFRFEVERLLKSGELVPVFHWYPTYAYVPIGAPAAGPPPNVRGESGRDDSEGNTFGASLQVLAQVGAMRDAAESGVPFCEVCNNRQSIQSAT